MKRFRILPLCLGFALLLGLPGCGDDAPPEKPEDETGEVVRDESGDAAAEAYARGAEAESNADFEAARDAYREAQSHEAGYRDTDERLTALGEIIAARTEYNDARSEGVLGDEEVAVLAINYARTLRNRPASQRNLHSARILLERAAQDAPANSDAQLELAVVAAERGDLDGAFTHSQAAADNGNADAHYQLAFLYRSRLGGDGPDPNQALEHAKQATELASEAKPHYYELLAVCHYDLGELDQAIESLEEACRLSTEPRYQKRLEGYVYERDGPPETPMDEPMDDAPMDDMPMDDEPMDEPPMDDMPMDEPPMDDEPMDDEPMDDDPMDDDPMDDDPMDDDPMDDDPMDEPPMDEPPMDEPPMDEPPMDEPPMDDEPMDEPPMDDDPMDDDPMDDIPGDDPMDDDPMDDIPGDDPMDDDPMDDVPGDDPMDDVPGDDPMDDVPGDDPMDDPMDDDPPMDDEPMDEPPMDDEPMDEPPMDDEPMDEPPMDDEPMDEPPMDDDDLDDIPEDEPPMDDDDLDDIPEDDDDLPGLEDDDLPGLEDE